MIVRAPLRSSAAAVSWIELSVGPGAATMITRVSGVIAAIGPCIRSAEEIPLRRST